MLSVTNVHYRIQFTKRMESILHEGNLYAIHSIFIMLAFRLISFTLKLRNIPCRLLVLIKSTVLGQSAACKWQYFRKENVPQIDAQSILSSTQLFSLLQLKSSAHAVFKQKRRSRGPIKLAIASQDRLWDYNPDQARCFCFGSICTLPLPQSTFEDFKMVMKSVDAFGKKRASGKQKGMLQHIRRHTSRGVFCCGITVCKQPSCRTYTPQKWASNLSYPINRPG